VDTGVDRHDSVGIREDLRAVLDGTLHQNDEVDLRALRDERSAVRERVGALLGGDVQRFAHPAAGLLVPVAAGLGAGRLPEVALLGVGAGVVPAGDERRLPIGDRRERLRRRAHP